MTTHFTLTLPLSLLLGVLLLFHTAHAQDPPNDVWCEYYDLPAAVPFNYTQPIWWMEYFSFWAVQNQTIMFKAYSGMQTDGSIQMMIGTWYCPTFINVNVTKNYPYPCPSQYSFGTTNITIDVVEDNQYIVFVHLSGGNYTIFGCENECEMICPGDCTGNNGVCDLDARKCVCNPGWTGPNCSVAIHKQEGATFNTTCFGDGCEVDTQCNATQCIVNGTCSTQFVPPPPNCNASEIVYDPPGCLLILPSPPRSFPMNESTEFCAAPDENSTYMVCVFTDDNSGANLGSGSDSDSTTVVTCGDCEISQDMASVACTECQYPNPDCVVGPMNCNGTWEDMCNVTTNCNGTNFDVDASCVGSVCTVSAPCLGYLCDLIVNMTCNDTECILNQTCHKTGHHKVPFGNMAIFYTVVIAVPSILLLSGIGGVGLVALHKRRQAKFGNTSASLNSPDRVARQPLIPPDPEIPPSPLSPPEGGVRRRGGTNGTHPSYGTNSRPSNGAHEIHEDGSPYNGNAGHAHGHGNGRHSVNRLYSNE